MAANSSSNVPLKERFDNRVIFWIKKKSCAIRTLGIKDKRQKGIDRLTNELKAIHLA